MYQCIQHKIFATVQVFLLMILSICQVAAQDKKPDVYSPVIQEVSVTTVAGNKHSFLVKIVDNIAVHRVLLSFRQEGATDYRNVAMQPSQDADWFQAEVTDYIASDTAIDYVIQATDIAGNYSKQSYKHYPVLSREGENDLMPPTPEVPEANTSESPQNKPANRLNTRNVLYTVLGVLAVGAVAASLGSDGSADPTPQCCELTITAPTP